MVEKIRAEQSQQGQGWGPFVLAATVALAAVAVAAPWTPWLDEGFGRAPWWVWGPLVGAVVLLVAGLGERRYTAWAGATGGAAVVAGVVSFLAWPREKVVLDGRTDDQIRARPWFEDVPSEEWHRLYAAEPPAAPLACALAAAVVVMLCGVVLVRRRRPEPVPEEHVRPYVTGDSMRRHARRMMAAGLAGVLVGGLLGAGTAAGASGLQRERMDAFGPWWGQLADSAPVPEGSLDDGSFEWDGKERFDHLSQRPDRVAWRHGFKGPVALSMCGRGDRARGTLVALEESKQHSVVAGYDTRDGSRRWSLAVRRQDTAALSQVAVGEGCSVLVLIGTGLLAVDAYTGQVRGGSVLPRAREGAWHFITPVPQEHPLPRLVVLAEADYAHLTAWEDGIVAVRRSDAEPVAWAARRYGTCTHLIGYYRNEPESGQLLMDDCADHSAVAILPEPEAPEELQANRRPEYRLPPLQPLLSRAETPVPDPPRGCRSGPLRLVSASVTTLVETEWECAGKAYRARIDLSDEAIALDGKWVRSPVADSAPDATFISSEGVHHLLEVWGDTVKMLSGDDFEPWWTVVPKRGDPVVGLADNNDVLFEDRRRQRETGRRELYEPILTLTHSGTLVTLADPYNDPDDARGKEPVRVIGSTDVAQQPCAGERELLADKVSGTALVLCTTDELTHVTAVTG
ncbi:hypothetical protein H1V43_28925 [Streptomyces sp. PSKA54]|uniref:Uncharacterized protein n=1 Tax=Streptomyces himalayensis subsp. aureolus TaxID=2758039 RepID=A0A7W2D674_9ACTN|nr:PQQ-binding-like beta-propeller repeat protein [Streptomyces himalayensis]MBA4865297.1 hypothetical protein [Streptomyces himalayensis subsp. aureolus]